MTPSPLHITISPTQLTTDIYDPQPSAYHHLTHTTNYRYILYNHSPLHIAISPIHWHEGPQFTLF